MPREQRPQTIPILLRGETGVGKDHLAEFIHSCGTEGRPFVPVDCGVLPESLSEAELFGYSRGAFTDAKVAKDGLIQVAEGGTLFFNEVANMSRSLQAKFLRVLEGRSFRQVGGTKEISMNARIIAATNVDLESAVKSGAVREDLYHRLNVLPFRVPALRERSEDIPELVCHFLQCEQSYARFSRDAIDAMMNHDWPGNIRELRNVVARSTFNSSADDEISAGAIATYLARPSILPIAQDEVAKFPTFQEMEINYLNILLSRTRWNLTEAGRIAGLSYKTIAYKAKKFGLK